MTTLPLAVLSNLHDAVPDHAPPHAVILAIHTVCYRIELEYGHTTAIEEVVSKIFIDLHQKRIPYAYCTPWRGLEERHKEEYSGPTVPLYDIMHDIGNAISNITYPIKYDAKRTGTLYPLRKQLLANEQTYRPAKEGLLLPHEIDAPPEELIRGFLANTPFLDFFDTRVPFRFPRSLWPSHMFALANTGWGKSQLLGTILREAVEDPQQRTVILFDPHAQKNKSVYKLALERVPRDRLIVIDPDTNPPEIGLMDFGVSSQHDALETFRFLISSLAGGLSPKQETALPSLFELLSKIHGASLVTLHELITEQKEKGKPLKYAAAIEQLDDVHQDFFNRLFYSGNYQETKDALQWKLLAALGRPTFKKMFSATRNSVSMDAYLARPAVVLVNGAERALGKEGMRIFLLFLIGQYYAAAKRRKAQHLAMCLVDEAWMVLQSPIIADILVELRGFNCSLVAMTQIWNQVADDVRPAILGSCAIKAVGAIQHNDASVFSREMFTSIENIRGLKPYDGPGTSAQWAVHLTGMSKAQVVSLPYGILEKMPKQSEPYRPQTHEGPSKPERSAHRDRSTEADAPTIPYPKPQAAAVKQQQNELSLRDTSLPLSIIEELPDDDEPMRKA